MKDYEACHRLWYYKSVLKKYPPSTPAQARGTVVHAALESYLKTGKVAPEIVTQAAEIGIPEHDLLAFVEAIKPYYGAPGTPGTVTEYKDEIKTYTEGPVYVTVVDHACEVTIDKYGTIPQIDDLKTTSDFRYCKTPEQLVKDVQMISYAKWALGIFDSQEQDRPDFVSLRHVYVRTRGKCVATVRSTLISPDDVEREWQRIVGVVRSMEITAEIKTVEEVEPNTESCSAYGGCFFKPQCFGAAAGTVSGLFDTTTPEKKIMSDQPSNVTTLPTSNNAPSPPAGRLRLLDRMKAGAAATPPTTAPVSVAPATLPATVAAICGAVCPIMATALCTLVKHTGDHESRSPEGGVVSWTEAGAVSLRASPNWAPVVTATPATAPSAGAVVDPNVAPVLPPDAPARTTTPTEVAVATAPKQTRLRKAKATAAPETPATQDASASPATSTVVVTPAPAVTVTTVVTTPSVAEALAASRAAAAAAPVVHTHPTPSAACALVELYIDCMPTKGGLPFMMAEDIIAPAAQKAAEANNVLDYRFISYTSKGELAKALRAGLGQMPACIVVSSSVPGADTLLEVLVPYAKRVVKALRG